MLGTNIAIMDKTLLRVAKVPHAKINNFDVIGQKPVSVEIILVCVLMQLNKLQVIERMNKSQVPSPTLFDKKNGAEGWNMAS